LDLWVEPNYLGYGIVLSKNMTSQTTFPIPGFLRPLSFLAFTTVFLPPFYGYRQEVYDAQTLPGVESYLRNTVQVL
jgi:hypothetical protein